MSAVFHIIHYSKEGIDIHIALSAYFIYRFLTESNSYAKPTHHLQEAIVILNYKTKFIRRLKDRFHHALIILLKSQVVEIGDFTLKISAKLIFIRSSVNRFL